MNKPIGLWTSVPPDFKSKTGEPTAMYIGRPLTSQSVMSINLKITNYISDTCLCSDNVLNRNEDKYGTL